jgi:archaeal flagellin FlaB
MKERRSIKSEQGFTALETAIIMMAFVVVAAVFAFTVLSAGMSSTEKSKQAIAAGLEEVQGTLAIKGGVIATSADGLTVDTLTFSLALGASGSSVDLTEPTTPKTAEDWDTEHVVVIEYRDAEQRETDLVWTTTFLGSNNGDGILDPRELVEITINLEEVADDDGQLNAIELGPNTSFVLEIRPPTGGVLPIERTTPPRLSAQTDLG